LERLLRIDEAETVELRIDLVDAGEAVSDRLYRRDLLGADAPRQLRRRRVAKLQIGHERSLSPPMPHHRARRRLRHLTCPPSWAVRKSGFQRHPLGAGMSRRAGGGAGCLDIA